MSHGPSEPLIEGGIPPTFDQFASFLDRATERFIGAMIQNVKNGRQYEITGAHYREIDMAICLRYTPRPTGYIPPAPGQHGMTIPPRAPEFSRSIAEMDFGNRFVFIGERVE